MASLQISSAKLLVVGIGGTTCAGSPTERALGIALQACAELGTATIRFGGDFLAALPHYTQGPRLTEVQQGLVDVLRRADAVILASPSYHGGVSGLLKNALDTLEELRADPRAYLDGRAIGCIVTARDGHAGSTVLNGLRSAAHALRGWPTPYGAVIDALETPRDGEAVPVEVEEALARVGRQVVALARAFRAAKAVAASDAALAAAQQRHAC